MKQQKEIIYEHYDSYEALPAEDRALVEAATEATRRAYAPLLQLQGRCSSTPA